MRRLASIALIAVCCALTPAAAQAAPAQTTMRMYDISVVPGGVAKMALAVLRSPANDQASPFQFIFDISAAAELVTIRPFGECVSTATRITCDMRRGWDVNATMEVAAKPGAELGATAKLPVRAVAGGRTLATATGTVTIAQGVDLAILDLQRDATVPTGGTTGLVTGVRNAGTEPVTGAILVLQTVKGLRPAGYRNCVATEFGAACRFDTVLAPGRDYRLATPWPLTATEQVWAPSRWNGSFQWLTEQDYLDRDGRLPTGGSGPLLDLVASPSARAVPQTDVGGERDGQAWDIDVTGVNRSNITARGARASGEVGSTVTVRVSARNNGPARLEGYGSQMGSYLTVTVKPPAGATVVGRHANCEPFNDASPVPPPWPPGATYDDGNFYCFSDWGDLSPYLPGQTVTWDFQLRIDKPGTLRGEIRTLVVAPATVPQGDPDPSDDRAAIVIAARGGSADGGAGGGGGGGLPITGSDATTAALAGLALLLAGAGARIATRRR